MALYRYEPKIGALPSPPDQASSSVAEFATARQLHLDSLKLHLAAAQNQMKAQADKKRVDRQFQVGEQVLKLQPYAQSSVVNRPFPKLAFKYFGPYTVLERIGPAAYHLNLPAYSPVYSTLPFLSDLSAVDLAPEALLDRRLVKKGNCAIAQVLVKWSGLPLSSATWEDFNVLRTRFPTSLAWGQASSPAGGDVALDGVNSAATA